jgi:PPM family protein phosphatase
MIMSASSVQIRSGSATDTGLRRQVNEDSHIAVPPLFLVADGMGGHRAGDLASAAVIEEFAVHSGRSDLTIDDVRETIARARARVEGLRDARGAGTTLSGAIVLDIDGGAYWLILNLGDSRTYLLSDGEFEQVSVDHSVVQELVDRGELDAAAATADARRNIITRAIGAGSIGEPDFWLIPARPGDRVLVCSDGLTGEVERPRIEQLMRSGADPQTTATQLVHEAMLRGGRDNITAVVVDAFGVGEPSAADIDDTLPHAPRFEGAGA